MKWPWENSTIDEGRFNRITEIEPAKIDRDNMTAMFNGRNGVFCCTLAQCECQDFRIRLKGKSPCKHILLLGAELGVYDPEELKRYFEGKRIVDKLSYAFGRYYLFNDPVMDDESYDALKREWADLIPNKQKEDQKMVAKADKPVHDAIVKHLMDEGAEYIDMTHKGGGLYFFSERIAEDLKSKGYNIGFAEKGSRSTSGRPAWYLRK